MSRIIERALDLINDHLKDQTSTFADPIKIKPFARGGYAEGGDPVDPVSQALTPAQNIPETAPVIPAPKPRKPSVPSAEGRVLRKAPVEELPINNIDDIQAAKENRAKRVAGKAWDIMSDKQRQQFMHHPDPALGGASISEADPQELLRQERAISIGHHGPWYHGSERIDRVVENNKIDPKRATSGPMPFFSDSPTLASKYAEGKKDTSLSIGDTGDVSKYFMVKSKDLGWRSKADVPVERSWNFLTPDVQKEIKSKAIRVGYEDPEEMSGDLKLHPEGVNGSIAGENHYNYILKNEAQGNPLKALRILWHDSGQLFNEEHKLEDIFKLAGFPHEISQKNAPWTTAKGVLPAMLRIESPLVTHNVDELNEKVIPHLEQAFAKDRTRKKQFGADMWDKNTRYTPKEWVSQLKEDVAKGDNSYVWTSIPDKITDQLKVLGYDGIIDTGGKGGGQDHRVAIPFYPHQVRSVFAKFNPEDRMNYDITKAEGGEVDDRDEGITAYHGSPHEFKSFDTRKIGTGEGAQAYGHGLYFAENEDVARNYRDALGGDPVGEVDRLIKRLENEHDSGTYLNGDEVMYATKGLEGLSPLKNSSDFKSLALDAVLNKNEESAQKLKELSKKHGKTGHMYEVRLDAHPEEHLLDWNKPLKEQHHKVIAAFNKAVVPVKDDEGKMIHDMYGDKVAHEYLGLFDKSKGSQAYKTFAEQIGGQDKASEALSKAGIRGIRYLDAGSRGQDERSGTHNYVIFDPQHIKVKRRYAEGGEVPKRDDEGIVAYAFGNSVPHIEDRISKGDFPEIDDESSSGITKRSPEPSEYIESGSMKHTHVHDETGSFISAVTRPKGQRSASITDLYVPEEHRGKGIGKILQNSMMKQFPSLQGQVSSKVAAKNAYALGRRLAGNEKASLEDIYKKIDEDSSANLWTPSKSFGGAIGLQPMFIKDPEQAGRRLIEWAFATAPLFHRADGGQVVHPSKKTKSDKKSSSPIVSRALDVVYKLPK